MYVQSPEGDLLGNLKPSCLHCDNVTTPAYIYHCLGIASNEAGERNTKNPTYVRIAVSLLSPPALALLSLPVQGVYNFCNPGAISHNEILDMYKKHIDPSFTYTNFTVEEQDKILVAGRSNNTLVRKPTKQADGRQRARQTGNADERDGESP